MILAIQFPHFIEGCIIQFLKLIGYNKTTSGSHENITPTQRFDRSCVDNNRESPNVVKIRTKYGGET